MNSAAETFPPTTIAGHPFLPGEKAGGLLNLRIALRGGPLLALARALGKLEGVRVTSGPEGMGRERGYLVHCLGFKMVLSSSPDGADDFAQALVSRAPQAALAVTSDLGSLLELLMSEPPPPEKKASDQRTRTGAGSSLRRTALRPGKPLTRKTPLRRKTPMARGRFGNP
ncbi:MAG TPA: hypothetical protein VGP07_16340 [Polyangia bacterium]|jgi:hypothetical protein